MREKKVLITGAMGFIGFNIWKTLLSKNYLVIACIKSNSTISPNRSSRVYQLNLTDSKLDEILSDEKPDYIVHCAGGASVVHSFTKPFEDFHNNVISTEYLLKSLSAFSPKSKLIFFSSAAVYGNPAYSPIDEKTATKPISPYGFHKLMCEQICEKYFNLYNIPITILRIFSVYGPYLRKQIFWDIAQKALKDEIITLHGTGQETRDFIYIDDLVNIVEKLFDYSNFSCNRINVATGRISTIKQIASMVLKKLKIDKEIVFNKQNKAGDPINWSVSTNLKEVLGITHWKSLEAGIGLYIDWFLSEVAL